MDVQYVNSFVRSITHVFETMVHTKVHVGNPFVKSDSNALTDIAGVIGVSGDVTGCVVLSFPETAAKKVVSAFAGVELDRHDPDFADAIGELANMVAGNAKKELIGMNVSVSLPSVIIDRQHAVSYSPSVPRVIIPCETAFGLLYVEIGLTATTQGSASKSAAATAGE
jgi:chemotaxis protein CheX